MVSVDVKHYVYLHPLVDWVLKKKLLTPDVSYLLYSGVADVRGTGVTLHFTDGGGERTNLAVRKVQVRIN